METTKSFTQKIKTNKIMKYLVIITDPKTNKKTAFYSGYYDYENNYDVEHKMIVIDMAKDVISFDGKTWEQIEFDHL